MAVDSFQHRWIRFPVWMFLNTCEAGGLEIRAAVAKSQTSNVTITVQVATGVIHSRTAQIWICTTTTYDRNITWNKSINFKCFSFELSIHQRILKKNASQFPKNILTLVIRMNVSWAANQHIRMISEGSCDTECELLYTQKETLTGRSLSGSCGCCIGHSRPCSYRDGGRAAGFTSHCGN